LKLFQPSHRGATVDFIESFSSLSFRRLAKTRRQRSVVRSIQFSKSLVPCRAYHFRSADALCQASDRVDEGAQPYGTATRLSSPLKIKYRAWTGPSATVADSATQTVT